MRDNGESTTAAIADRLGLDPEAGSFKRALGLAKDYGAKRIRKGVYA